ncbi:MAG TPA: CDF family Co(II)/Ni(II) efflux transporter DmeF [Steroidobacteraceae bacterium]|nr:CDF family Co(II)/Ni(II) efflux transporter DmeF [Steroidobacteraceae bacterium]
MSLAAEDLRHHHQFDQTNPLAERGTRLAVYLTAAMMVAEIAGGWLLNSMALLADGWHMSSHALALGVSVLAYSAARRYSTDPRFNFGTWKIEVLGGYTSAVLLVGVAGLMLFQSVERLAAPRPIHFDEAILIAAVGLAVNLICARLLSGGSHHHHGGHTDDRHGHGGRDHGEPGGGSHGHDPHGHDPHGDGPHGHAPHAHTQQAPAQHGYGRHDQHRSHARHGGHPHHPSHGHAHDHDLNLRSAYLHVLADAATSVLAILALLGGKYLGANWLDPVMGIVGAGLVSVWAYGLLRDSGRVLLDAELNVPVAQEIRETIEQGPIRAEICDLHVWRVGKGKFACIVGLVTAERAEPEDFKNRLRIHEELVHITVEVNRQASAA